jgi:hypothetical protein
MVDGVDVIELLLIVTTTCSVLKGQICCFRGFVDKVNVIDVLMLCDVIRCILLMLQNI